jgi:hypothetical protein
MRPVGTRLPRTGRTWSSICHTLREVLVCLLTALLKMLLFVLLLHALCPGWVFSLSHVRSCEIESNHVGYLFQNSHTMSRTCYKSSHTNYKHFSDASLVFGASSLKRLRSGRRTKGGCCRRTPIRSQRTHGYIRSRKAENPIDATYVEPYG